MAKTDIWMPLYVGDYLADTMGLSAQEHGAYLLLLMTHWKQGSLPNDQGSLSRIGRIPEDQWPKVWRSLAPFFTIDGEHVFQKRLLVELEKAQRKRTGMAKNGVAGAIAKWGSDTERNKLNRSERLTKARQIARHSPEEWQALIVVCGGKCLKCGLGGELVKDHIIPVCFDGSDGIDNIQPLCRSCNAAKGSDRTDYRPDDWSKRLSERLANVRQTPAPSPSKSQVVSSRKILPIKLPDWISERTWIAFEQMRKRIKKPLTEEAATRIIKRLQKWRDQGQDVEEILSRSIENEWQGLWPEETNGKRGKDQIGAEDHFGIAGGETGSAYFDGLLKPTGTTS